MRNVLKSGSISFNDKPVMIPDAVIIKPTESQQSPLEISGAEINLSVYSDEDKRRLEEYFEKRKTALMSGINEERERLEKKAKTILTDAQKEADELLSQAWQKAEKIVADAERKSTEIVEEAEKQAVFTLEEAERQGLEKGRRQKAEEIDECIIKLQQFMIALKNSQSEYFEDMYLQLKYFAIDIAEKIVYKKIEEDEKFLYELVVQALKDFKSAEWINVEISEQMAELVDYLVSQQECGLLPSEADFATASTENGSVRIETQSNVCDASVSTQLRNIKSYFDSYGEGNEADSGDNTAQT